MGKKKIIESGTSKGVKHSARLKTDHFLEKSTTTPLSEKRGAQTLANKPIGGRCAQKFRNPITPQGEITGGSSSGRFNKLITSIKQA